MSRVFFYDYKLSPRWSAELIDLDNTLVNVGVMFIVHTGALVFGRGEKLC